MTPADVAALINWSEAAGEPVDVNYLGLPISLPS